MEHKKQSKPIVKIATAVLFFVFSGIISTGSALASLNVPQINRDLNLGSVGDDVKNLQQFLNNTGYAIAATGSGSPGQETYYFGALTQSALKKFQTAQGINANGIVDQATRELLIRLSGQNGTSNITATANTANAGTTSAMLAQIELLKKQIAALQEQLKAMITDSDDKNDEAPQISDIVINNGGDDGYIDNGDTIKITFDRAIDPESINGYLKKGNSVESISYSKTGGVSVSSSGLVTIKNIAKFDIGSVKNSGNFTAKIALSSTGKVLTIKLTGGNDIEINDEDFDNAEQLDDSVEDEDGNPMENNDIDAPSGTFGGAKTDTEDEEEKETPSISSIVISDGNKNGYINSGDAITIVFDRAINPASINSSLAKGSSVADVAYSTTGGVNISSSGVVTVKNIATFDMGSVGSSGNFTVKIALNSTGKVLTITLTGGNDISITEEILGAVSQLAGIIKDETENTMVSGNIDAPTGTFGGKNTTSDANNQNTQTTSSHPEITSIVITAGNYNVSTSSGYYYSSNGAYNVGSIGINDMIAITFSEAIDPTSINASLTKGGNVSGIGSGSVGGVNVTADGIITVNGIASFDMGSVNAAANFTSKLGLDTTGKILTITITSGNSSISNENYGGITQISGKIKNIAGTAMPSATKSTVLSGTFGFSSYNYYSGASTSSYTNAGTTSYTSSNGETYSGDSWSSSYGGSSSGSGQSDSSYNLGNLDNDNYIYSSYVNSGTSTSYNYSSLADTGGSYGGWVPAF